MKKLIAVLLAATLTFSMVACGGNNATTETTESAAAELTVKDATELFTNVWNEMPEDKKFPAMGGDGENFVDGTPGVYNIAKAEELGMEWGFCVPTTSSVLMDDASTLMHGMMANNFTGGVYHVTDAANVQTVVDEIKERTENNQWMCGMPETFVIATVGDNYVVSAFGLNSTIDPFKEALTAAYGDAVSIVVEQPIVE